MNDLAFNDPWWLILLRMLLAALVILALAHPFLNPGAKLHGSGPLRFKGGVVGNLYKLGALRNIATFHQQVTGGIAPDQANTAAVRRGLDVSRSMGRGPLLDALWNPMVVVV